MRYERLAMFIPLLYTIYSRGGLFTVINNYLYGPTILLFLAIVFQAIEFDILTIVTLLTSYILFALTYEVGYLLNDLLAVKFEKKPTIRTRIEYSNRTIGIFIFLRILAAALVILLIMIFNINTEYFTSIFFKLLLIVLCIYVTHNFIHLVVDIHLRVLTFVGLKTVFWFVPILYVYPKLSEGIVVTYFITFCGALVFYVYSYFTSKGFVSTMQYNILPKDLEGKLLVFFTGAYMIAIPFFADELLIYAPWVYVYMLLLWYIRKLFRLTKKREYIRYKV
jgi:hypothetical protein